MALEDAVNQALNYYKSNLGKQSLGQIKSAIDSILAPYHMLELSPEQETITNYILAYNWADPAIRSVAQGLGISEAEAANIIPTFYREEGGKGTWLYSLPGAMDTTGYVSPTKEFYYTDPGTAANSSPAPAKTAEQLATPVTIPKAHESSLLSRFGTAALYGWGIPAAFFGGAIALGGALGAGGGALAAGEGGLSAGLTAEEAAIIGTMIDAGELGGAGLGYGGMAAGGGLSAGLTAEEAASIGAMIDAGELGGAGAGYGGLSAGLSNVAYESYLETGATSGLWEANLSNEVSNIAAELAKEAGGSLGDVFANMTPLDKASLALKGLGLANTLIPGKAPSVSTLSSPDITPEQQQLLDLQYNTLKDALEQQGYWDTETQKYYEQLMSDTQLTPEEEMSFEQEYNLQIQALNEQYAREAERYGGSQMADLVSRGMLDSTVGAQAISQTQEDFANILSQQVANLGMAKETAKSDLEAAKRQLAQSGYELSSNLASNQLNTALSASTALQNFYLNQGNLQANTALQNALAQQTAERYKYNQRINLLSGAAGLGLGLFSAGV